MPSAARRAGRRSCSHRMRVRRRKSGVRTRVSCQFAAGAGVDFAKLGEEDMVVRTRDGNLIISGGRPRGTLYAAYEFLERHVGCHWLAWDTAVIPSKPDLSIPAIETVMRPAFSPRLIYIDVGRLGGGKLKGEYELFERRNRGQFPWVADIGGPLAYTATPHTFYLFVDPKEWFDKHPEYYSMDDKGKRTYGTPGPTPGAAGSELCLSNPDLPGVMAKSVLKYMKGRDAAEFAKSGLKPCVVDITQEDNAHYICKCPSCVAIAKEEGQGESGLMIRFVNQVADLVAQERPDVKLRTFAYVNTDIAPLHVKARDNVTAWWCDLYGFSDCFRPLEHPVNRGQLERLQGWSKTAKDIQVWDYWNMDSRLSAAAVPQFVPVRTIAADCQLFKRCNASGIFAEYEMGVTRQNFFALDVWAGMQLMSNPELSPDSLVTTFMDGYYGSAAAPMRAFHDALEKAMMDEKEPMFTLPRPPERAYVNVGFLSRCRALLLQAEAATGPRSTERLHVWKEMVVVYNCLLNQWGRLQRGGEGFAFPKAETLDKYAQIREAVILHWTAPGKRRVELLEDLRSELACLRGSFPLPERFKGLPDGDVVDLPYPKMPSWSVKDDPDALGGRAAGHQIVPVPGEPEGPPRFGIYDRASKRRGPTLILKDVPADEKYHLHKLGPFALGRDTIVWGHQSWKLTCANLALEYVNADGVKGNPNLWDVYVSVKATGPLYVPGSKKENALWCDRIILAKPGAVPEK